MEITTWPVPGISISKAWLHIRCIFKKKKAYCWVLNCLCGGVTNHCITACVPKYNDAGGSLQQITQSDCNALMQCNAFNHIWHQISSHCLKSSAGCSTYNKYAVKILVLTVPTSFAMFPGTCAQWHQMLRVALKLPKLPNHGRPQIAKSHTARKSDWDFLQPLLTENCWPSFPVGTIGILCQLSRD